MCTGKIISELERLVESAIYGYIVLCIRSYCDIRSPPGRVDRICLLPNDIFMDSLSPPRDAAALRGMFSVTDSQRGTLSSRSCGLFATRFTLATVARGVLLSTRSVT